MEQSTDAVKIEIDQNVSAQASDGHSAPSASPGDVPVVTAQQPPLPQPYAYGAPVPPGYAPPPAGAPSYVYGAPVAQGYAPPLIGAPGYAYGAPVAPGYVPPPLGAQGYAPPPAGAPVYIYGTPGTQDVGAAASGEKVPPPSGAIVYPSLDGVPVYAAPVAGAMGVPVMYAPPMAVAMAAPQPPPVHPRDQITTGRWEADLCGCCTHCVPNLFMSWCCPCVALAQVYARLGIQRYDAALWTFFFVYLFGFIGFVVPSRTTYRFNEETWQWEEEYTSPRDMIVSALIFISRLIFCYFVWRARSTVRARFAIPGSGCGDCCVSLCCSCCAIAQMATHTRSYVPEDCSFAPPDVLPAFTG